MNPKGSTGRKTTKEKGRQERTNKRKQCFLVLAEKFENPPDYLALRSMQQAPIGTVHPNTLFEMEG